MTPLQIISIVSTLFLLIGIYSYKVQSSSFSWNENTGKIIDQFIQHDNSGDMTKYYPKVTYEYSVNDKSYTCSTLKLMGNTFFGSENEANIFLEKYPKGSNITLYYDPSKPSRAILEHVNIIGAWVFLGIGILMSLGCGFFWMKKFNII